MALPTAPDESFPNEWSASLSSVMITINKNHDWKKTNTYWWVVYLPLWKIWKSVGMILPNIWTVINFMFQTTNQHRITYVFTPKLGCCKPIPYSCLWNIYNTKRKRMAMKQQRSLSDTTWAKLAKKLPPVLWNYRCLPSSNKSVSNTIR